MYFEYHIKCRNWFSLQVSNHVAITNCKYQFLMHGIWFNRFDSLSGIWLFIFSSNELFFNMKLSSKMFAIMIKIDTQNFRFVSVHWVSKHLSFFLKLTLLQSSGDSCLTSNNCDPGKLCVNLHNTNPVCIPDICTYSTTSYVHMV